MQTKKIVLLLKLINEIVNEGDPWREKANSIMDQANDDDKVSLNEFAGWFEEEPAN